MLSILLISFGIILILVGIWFKFFKPILKELTIHVDQKYSQTRTDICKILITLSTASIVLTINLIKGDFINTNFLIASWVCFLVTIVLCILVLFFQYLKNLMNELIVESEKNDKKFNENISKLMSHSLTLEPLIFISFYSEMVILIFALISLGIFGIANI